MKAELVNIQGVDCLRLRSGNPRTAIIFFHGYGANMHDLFPLWELWHQDDFNWYFPNGIQSLPMGYYEGRAWFSIDVESLEKAMREGRHRDMRGSLPPEFEDALKHLENFVLDLSQIHEQIILGGFSQGAMLASHLAMKESFVTSGVVLLSGALVAEAKLPKAPRAIPFYQSHGSSDPILSIEGAKDLEKKLQSLNFQGKLHTFRGGHEIPSSVIQEVKTFLSQFAT
jgi:phospholipase/carboxylesterase